MSLIVSFMCAVGHCSLVNTVTPQSALWTASNVFGLSHFRAGLLPNEQRSTVSNKENKAAVQSVK